MKPYVVSLALGLLVGIIYAFFQVRSPAPPVVALVGLLGILLGEQIPPLVKHVLANEPLGVSWLGQQVKPHVFGQLPRGPSPGRSAKEDAQRSTSEERRS
jgi:XapX domain-containing protein